MLAVLWVTDEVQMRLFLGGLHSLTNSTVSGLSVSFACCNRSPPASCPWIAVKVCSPSQSLAAPWWPRPAPPPVQLSPVGTQSAGLTAAPAAAPSSAAPPAGHDSHGAQASWKELVTQLTVASGTVAHLRTVCLLLKTPPVYIFIQNGFNLLFQFAQNKTEW